MRVKPDYKAQAHETRLVLDGLVSDGFWIGTSGAADLFSTALALKNCPRCAEGNPLGFNVEARVALKAAGMLAAAAACYKLRADGHHRWAKGLRIAVVVLQSAAAANNLAHAVKK